jgi:metal-responsive CopG/Arc/MetJ family transcriptional regulator
MREKTKTPIAVKFDTELLTRLDEFRESLPYDTTRTSLIERAVRRMLDQDAKVVPIRRRK